VWGLGPDAAHYRGVQVLRLADVAGDKGMIEGVEMFSSTLYVYVKCAAADSATRARREEIPSQRWDL